MQSKQINLTSVNLNLKSYLRKERGIGLYNLNLLIVLYICNFSFLFGRYHEDRS